MKTGVKNVSEDMHFKSQYEIEEKKLHLGFMSKRFVKLIKIVFLMIHVTPSSNSFMVHEVITPQ